MNNKIIPGGREKSLSELDTDIVAIKSSMVSIVENFFSIGAKLLELKENKSFKLKNYKNFIEFVKSEFNLSKNQSYNLIAIYQKFSKPEFGKFNYTQLTEMLPLSDEQIKKVDDKMSSKKIRDIKKDDKEEKDSIQFGEQVVIDVAPGDIVEDIPIIKQPLKKQVEFWSDRCTEITAKSVKELKEKDEKIHFLIDDNNGMYEKIEKLENENSNLLSKIIDFEKLIKENEKLKKENLKLKKNNLDKIDKLVQSVVKE